MFIDQNKLLDSAEQLGQLWRKSEVQREIWMAKILINFTGDQNTDNDSVYAMPILNTFLTFAYFCPKHDGKGAFIVSPVEMPWLEKYLFQGDWWLLMGDRPRT
jgi:hypothetical protein